MESSCAWQWHPQFCIRYVEWDPRLHLLSNDIPIQLALRSLSARWYAVFAAIIDQVSARDLRDVILLLSLVDGSPLASDNGILSRI